MLATINSFQNHPNVVKPSNLTQFFNTANENKVRKIIKNRNVRKTREDSEIPTKIIKNLIWIYLVVLFVSNFNHCISIGEMNS